jgi:flagellar capping protein FliD
LPAPATARPTGVRRPGGHRGELRDAGGLVARAKDRIDDQVQNISGPVDVLDAQLMLRRSAVQEEFIAADQAMSQLNSQVSSLSSLQNQYRLF